MVLCRKGLNFRFATVSPFEFFPDKCPIAYGHRVVEACMSLLMAPAFVISMSVCDDLFSTASYLEFSLPVALGSCQIVMSDVVVMRNLTVPITGYVSSGP